MCLRCHLPLHCHCIWSLQSDSELTTLQTQVIHLQEQEKERKEQQQVQKRVSEQLVAQRMQQLQERVRVVQAAAQGEDTANYQRWSEIQ